MLPGGGEGGDWLQVKLELWDWAKWDQMKVENIQFETKQNTGIIYDS